MHAEPVAMKKEEEGGKMSLKIKGKILSIYYELMHQRNIPFSVVSLMLSFMFLNLFGYIYSRKANFPFQNDTIYSFFAQFLEIIRIYPLIEDSRDTAYYFTILFSIVIIIFIYILSLIYVGYSIRINKYHFLFPRNYLRFMSLAFNWVLLNPIMECLLSIFLCEEGNHIIVHDMECWTGIHFLYVFIFTLFILIFISIILLICCFFNESAKYSTDSLGRLDSNLEIYLAIYRIILASSGVLLTDPTFHWLLIAIFILFSANLFKFYLYYIPFYHSRTSVLFGACALSYLWMSINLLLSKIMEGVNYSQSEPTIIILVGIVLSWPIIQKLREWRINSLFCGKKYNSLKNDYELDIYINRLVELIEVHQTPSAETALIGFILNHIQDCQDPECPLNHQKPLYLPTTQTFSDRNKSNLRDPIVLLYCVNSIFQFHTRNTVRKMAHYIYANFLFFKMKNIHLALVELFFAEKSIQNSFQQQFSVYRAKMIIQDYLLETNKLKHSQQRTIEKLDLTIVIVFENLFAKLEKAIEKSTTEHIEFWVHLNSFLPDLNRIHKIGLNIINYSKKCYEVWHKLIKINNSYPKALYLYGYYLLTIKNDQEEGEKTLEESRAITLYRSMDENITDFEQLFADDSAIIIMGGNKENQFKITKTNSGIQLVFGYSQDSIIGQNINILMPQLISEKHESFVQNYYQTGEQKLINQQIHLFAIKRTGYVFAMNLIVKTVPTLYNGIEYIALIRGYGAKENEIILTDKQGKIAAISPEISGLIGITSPDILLQKSVFLQLVCPDLLDLHPSTNTTKFEQLRGECCLNFQVPKNVVSIAGDMSKNLEIWENHANKAESDSNQSIEGKSKEIMELEINQNMSHAPSLINAQINSPEIVVKMKHMLHNFRKIKREGSQRENILKRCIGYEDCEYEQSMNCEVSELNLGNGDLKLKVFRIHKHKKYGMEVETSESDTIYRLNFHDVDVKFKAINLKTEGEDNKEESKIERLEIFKELKDLNIIEENKGDLSSKLDEVAHIQANGYTNININANVKKSEEVQLEDDIGSVSISSKSSLIKFIQSLRNSMYEKYNPPSIVKLKISAQVVFLILLIFTTIDYFVAGQLYNDLETTVEMIDDAEDRMRGVIEIGAIVRSLSLINPNNTQYHTNIIDLSFRSHIDYRYVTYKYIDLSVPYMNYRDWLLKHLASYASKLKIAQNNLSTRYRGISRSEEIIDYVNPKKVRVYYHNKTGVPNMFEVDCWTAMIDLVTRALFVHDLPQSEFNDENEAVYFILKNTFNDILLAVNEIFNGIIENAHMDSESSQTVLLIFLFVSALAISLSTLVIIIVTTRVSKNKEEIVFLFLEIPRKNIVEELNKCRKFRNIVAGDKDYLEEAAVEECDEDGKFHDEEEKLVNEGIADATKRKRGKRKYKPFSRHTILIILKFLCVLVILQSYFLFSYLNAQSFLKGLLSMAEEAALLSERHYENSFLIKSVQELIGTNGTSYILNENIGHKIEEWLNIVINDQAELLDLNSKNKDYNDETYKEHFYQLVHDDGCGSVLYEDTELENCRSFRGGILNKGIHSANIAFWDAFRDLTIQFLSSSPSNRTVSFLQQSLNSNSMIYNEILEVKYFGKVWDLLEGEIEDSISVKFSSERLVIFISFFVYFCVLLLIYIIWKFFLESTRNSLWTTKSLLVVIPPQVIYDVKNIKEFLVSTSKSMIFGLSQLYKIIIQITYPDT